MRISCIGGGPAGLYFAICAKLQEPGHEITVIERDPLGETYGWGVGYWEQLLEVMFERDPASASLVRAASSVWDGREVRVAARSASLGGYGYTIRRSNLLEILTDRAAALGVDLRHTAVVEDLSDHNEADLVVVSDGANSQIRDQHQAEFGTRIHRGRNRYLWLGTTHHFSKMTFAFERTDAGWIWFYGYPSGPGIGTCVVECSPQTWGGLGLDTSDATSGLSRLEEVFAQQLAGQGLISRDRGKPARWEAYREVSNARWTHDNVVLLGDAAHTVHFSMGSGTGLAMTGAATLGSSLAQRPHLAGALRRYERKRRSAVELTQAAGRLSMRWFEDAAAHLGQDAADVAHSLAARYQTAAAPSHRPRR